MLLFNVSSRHCVLRHFDKPSPAWILYAARDGQLSSAPAVSPQRGENEDWRRRRQTGLFPVREPQSDGILLKFPQVQEKTCSAFLKPVEEFELFSELCPVAGSWRPSMSSLCPDIHFQFHHDLSLSFLLIFFQTKINFTPKVPLPGRYVTMVHYHQPEHTSFPVEVRVVAGREWKGECVGKSGDLVLSKQIELKSLLAPVGYKRGDSGQCLGKPPQ